MKHCLYDGVYLNTIIIGDLFKEESQLLHYKQTIEESFYTEYSVLDLSQNKTKELKAEGKIYVQQNGKIRTLVVTKNLMSY